MKRKFLKQAAAITAALAMLSGSVPFEAVSPVFENMLVNVMADEVADLKISSAEDWNAFASAVSDGKDYEGKLVKLTKDISVTTAVGQDGKPFKGTFDGGGNTITADIKLSEDYCALFREAQGAAVRNLKLSGSISQTGSHRYCAGLIAHSSGTLTLDNCTVSAAVSTAKTGDAIFGGVVAACSYNNGTTDISNCIFNGSLTATAGTYNSGGFVGYKPTSGSLNLSNCLFAPASVYLPGSPQYNFSRESVTKMTDCYYTYSLTKSTSATYRQGAEVVEEAPANGLYKQVTAADGNNYYASVITAGVNSVYASSTTTVHPKPSVTFCGNNLTEGTDYTLVYSAEDDSAGGDFTVTVNGKGDFSGSAVFNYRVLNRLRGEGTQQSPYLIATVAEWDNFAQNVAVKNSFKDKTIMLENNIGSAEEPVTTVVGLASDARDFEGTFDGNNKTLTVNINETGRYTAPFSCVDNGTIKNLTVEGYVNNTPEIIAGYMTAGLAAHVQGTVTIENCVVNTNVTTNPRSFLGGVAAYSSGTLTVKDTIFGGTLKCTANYDDYTTAGFVAFCANNLNLTLNNCIFKGSMETVGNCYPIAAKYYDNYHVTTNLTNVYAIADTQYRGASNYEAAAGAQVYTQAPGSGIYKTVTAVDNNTYYSATTVSGTHAFYRYTGNEIEIAATVTDADGTVLKKDQDYSLTAKNASGAYVDTVRDMGKYTLIVSGIAPYTGSLEFDFEVSDCVKLETLKDWEDFANNVNSGIDDYSGVTVSLEQNIDGITTPVGNYGSYPFSGTFNGNGHTLGVNLSNTDSSKQGIAPFRYIKNAEIKLLNVTGTIESSSYYTSGLVGFADGTNTLDTCSVFASLDLYNNYAGGIVGHGLNSSTTLKNCVFEGTITGINANRSNIGGIWGWSDGKTPTFENCLENGIYVNIASMHPIGLQTANGTMTNCYYLNNMIGTPSNYSTISGAERIYKTQEEVENNLPSKAFEAVDGNTYYRIAPPEGLSADTDDYTLYINMPESGSDTLALDDYTGSFMVYDDGGKNGKYTIKEKSLLTITAPEGYKVTLSGYIKTRNRTNGEWVSVYNGTDESGIVLLNQLSSSPAGEETSLGEITSQGRSLTILFRRNTNQPAQWYDGLYITAEIVPDDNYFGVTLDNSSEFGTLFSDKDKAVAADKVTLTAEPAEGCHLEGITLVNNDESQTYLPCGWYTDNEVSFTMPNNAVTAVPNFVKDADGYAIVLPVKGTVNASIPVSVKRFTVYDDGGKENEFSSNCDSKLIITAPEGRKIKIGGSCSVNASVSKLRIYDGTDTSAEPAFIYEGNNYDVDTLITTNNTAAVTFTSQSNAYGSGFEIDCLVGNNTITVDAGIKNGTVSSSREFAAAGEKVTLTVEPNEGYHTVSVSFNGTAVEPVNGVYAFDMPAGDVSVTAAFELDKFTIEFDANGGTGKMEPQDIVYNYYEYLNNNTFVRAGYTFAGWNTMANGEGTAYEDHHLFHKAFAGNGGSMTLYAQWNDKHTLKFTVNDEVYGEVLEVPYGAEISAPATAPTLDGHVFAGWLSLPKTMPDCDLTVSAIFVPYGDANLNGRLDTEDYALVLKYISSAHRFFEDDDENAIAMDAADFDRSGSVDMLDVIKMMQEADKN